MINKIPLALPGRTLLSRIRGLCLCGLYCICSICITFAALEGILKLLSPLPHTTLRPMFYPNIPGDYEPSINVVDSSLSDLPYTVTTTPQGFRGSRSIATTKTPAIKRVLCLGDSFTFGVGVETPQSYPEQLWHLLKRQAPDEEIEVINAGVPMFDLLDEIDYWRTKGNLLRPDVVVLQFYSNDIYDLSRPWPWRLTMRQSAQAFPLPLRMANTTLFHLAFKTREAFASGNDLYDPYARPLDDALRNKVMASPLAKALLTPTDHEKALLDDRVAFHQGFESWDLERFWDAYRSLLVQLKNEVEATGAKFLLVTIPYHEQIYNHPTANVQQTQLEAFADDMNLSVLNLTPVFRFWAANHPNLPLYNLQKGDFHLTAAGNGVVATTVANQLRPLLHPGIEHPGRASLGSFVKVTSQQSN